MVWNFKDLFSRTSPAAAAACFERGNAHVARREWQAALDCYSEVVRLAPKHAEAHAYCGNVLRQLHAPDAALAAYDRALAVRPRYAEVHYNRAALLHQQRRVDAALAGYDAALSIDPSLVHAHFRRGEVLRELGRPQQAVASFRQALAVDPAYGEAYFSLGLLDSSAGNDADAVANFDMAIRLKPDFARAFGNRAQAQARLRRFEAARADHDQAVLLDPRDAALHFNRGAFLSDLELWHDAIPSYRAAIALQPDHAAAYCNLGLAQQQTGDSDAALQSYSQALAIDPRLAIAFNNRGNLLRSRKQFAEARRDYEHAVTLDPRFAEAHYNIGQLDLLLGDLAAGWPKYEWRASIAEALAINPRKLPQPVWTGEQSLQGAHIFLHAEQGLGDTVQFCRYVSLVAARGARVTLEVQPALAGLLANLDGVSHLRAFGAPIPAADYQCSLMSLPGAFGTTLATIPRSVPYLRADPDKAARWRDMLGPGKRPRVGLAWRGNPRNTNDPSRRVPLSQLLAHLPEQFEYVCLQNEIRDDDRETLQACGRVRTVESELRDFTDTAALIDTLDLVVSVCTSLAHLSGALGKTTWVLLAYLPDWRWLMDRSDSPWYPTATLYRQPAANDWDGVLAQLRDDLRRFAVSR